MFIYFFMNNNGAEDCNNKDTNVNAESGCGIRDPRKPSFDNNRVRNYIDKNFPKATPTHEIETTTQLYIPDAPSSQYAFPPKSTSSRSSP